MHSAIGVIFDTGMDFYTFIQFDKLGFAAHAN